MNKFLSIFLLVAVLGARKTIANVPISDFYPYGQEHGDLVVPTADDNFVEHVLSTGTSIYFFNQGYDRVFVNNNGGISFVRGVSQYTPTCNPQSTPMIVPFWADVDTRHGGYVWYRESTEQNLLEKATQEVLTAFPGLVGSLNVNRILIFTWDDVAFYGSAACGADAQARRNTFQTIVALGDDGHMSFIIFNYDKVNWITGRASGGDCNGRGGTPAKAGFDTGDGQNFFSLPGTCTEEIDQVIDTTNVFQPGKWIFRVDQEHVEEPPVNLPEPIPDPETEEPPTEGECNPHDCNLIGYCYQYAQCDYETRTYRTQYCSPGLYWNPHNVTVAEAFRPVPVISGRSLSKRQIELGGDNHHGANGQEEEQCHGSCDVWENLSEELQAIYLSDESCFPRCHYTAVAECENRYLFHPHNTDARHFETLNCPIDTRQGMNVPLVWVEERQTCDFCYNTHRINFYHSEENGTVAHVEPCCERYDQFMDEAEAEPQDHTIHYDEGHHAEPAYAPAPADYHHDDHYNQPAVAPAEDHYQYPPPGRALHQKGHEIKH